MACILDVPHAQSRERGGPKGSGCLQMIVAGMKPVGSGALEVPGWLALWL